jgi:hypothetical protein
MLWTGSDAKRAAKTRIYTAHAGKFDGELGLILCSTDFNSGLCWRIKALEPDYKTEIAETSGQLRTRNRYIDLPDLINLTGNLDRLLANRKKVRDGSPLFMASPEALEKSLKSWLKNYSPDGRITVHKLGEALWHHLFRESGDPALASCITGTRHPLARVRLHYTTPHVANLQAIYKRTVTGISDASYAVLKKQPPKVESSPVNSTGAVGARLCPTVDAVRHSFASLVNDIRKAANYVDRPGFTRYHNLYTLYTLQLFAYTTTCRAIVTPYMTLSRVHSERGIASLSDKDDEHRHKTRLIWIPPQVRDQMHSYDLHLACLHRQLIRPPTAVVAEPAFFLDHAFTPVMARPKIIGEHLSPYLNVRPNTHRRFLRTELIERGCTPEVADAFMGHWYEGEEPFGKYSSFSFLDYLKELQHYLLPLLQAIGPFPVLRSRLV